MSTDIDYIFKPDDDALAFIPPENSHCKIWRYLDFTKFVAMLDKQGLFFSRSDKLGDPLEGSYALSNYQDWSADTPIREKEFLDYLEEMRPKAAKLSEWARYWMFISCWHMNEHESAAMWKLYSRSAESIAIQTTFSRLRSFLKDYPLIGQVRYVDYQTERIPHGSRFYPFMYKRKSFEHEKELRVIKHRIPNGGIDTSILPSYLGIWEEGNLSELIERIYVSPTADGWFTELVKSMATRFELMSEVVQSSLNAQPLF